MSTTTKRRRQPTREKSHPARLNLRLTDRQHRALTRAAKSKGVSAGEIVRQILAKAIAPFPKS